MRRSFSTILIFSITFSLVFSLFVLVEPSMSCSKGEGGSVVPRCHVINSGKFVLGIVLVAFLTLVDMGLVYMSVVDFLF